MTDLNRIAEQLRTIPYHLPADIPGVYRSTMDLVEILGRVDHVCRQLATIANELESRAAEFEVDELGPPADPGELLTTAAAMLRAAGQKVLAAQPDVDGAISRLSRIRSNAIEGTER